MPNRQAAAAPCAGPDNGSGAMTGATYMANSRGRKLYRVTLSAQERWDLKAIVDGTGAAWRRAQILMLRGRSACRCRHCAGHGDGRAFAQALRPGGAGRRPQPQGAGEPSAETAGRGDGSEAGRPVRPRPRAVDAEAARRPSGGNRRAHFGRNGQEDAKKEIKPWLKQYWCIPPHRSAQFVAADVLDTYQRDFAGDEVLRPAGSRRRKPPVLRSAGGGRL